MLGRQYCLALRFEAPRAYFGDPYQTSPRGGFLCGDIHSPSGETERGRFRKRPVLISEGPRAYLGSEGGFGTPATELFSDAQSL